MSHWPVVRSVKLVVMRALNQEKLTSPSGCVLVYDSVGEPAKHSVRGSGECSASGSEFEVGGATSGEDFPGELPGELRWRLLLRVIIALA